MDKYLLYLRLEYRPVFHNITTKFDGSPENADWYRHESEAHEVGETSCKLVGATHYTIDSRYKTKASDWYDGSDGYTPEDSKSEKRGILSPNWIRSRRFGESS